MMLFECYLRVPMAFERNRITGCSAAYNLYTDVYEYEINNSNFTDRM
jgi:hypothetical protein